MGAEKRRTLRASGWPVGEGVSGVLRKDVMELGEGRYASTDSGIRMATKWTLVEQQLGGRVRGRMMGRAIGGAAGGPVSCKASCPYLRFVKSNCFWSTLEMATAGGLKLG